MDHVTENAIAGIPPETVELEMTLQDKHDSFMVELTTLAEQYGVNILLAVNYKAENETAIEYIGEANKLTEMGLKYAITKGNV
jgi:hypothetical protein